MKIKSIPETGSLLIYEMNAVEICATLDVVDEVLRPKRRMWIDDVLVLRFDTIGSFEEAFDCLHQVELARLA